MAAHKGYASKVAALDRRADPATYVIKNIKDRGLLSVNITFIWKLIN